MAFIQTLYDNTNFVTTKAGAITSQNETEILNSVKPLLDNSKTFLASCGYDSFEDEFSNDDPNIIILAEALADYTMRTNAVTGGGFAEGAETVLSCFGEAVGLGGTPFAIDAYFTKGMSRAALKAAAKKLASRAIPYVGAAIFAGTMAFCLYNHWD